jgi:iron complex transport system permease protein
MGLIYLLSVSRRLKSMETMLLLGVMISFMASSLFMLLMALSRAEDLHGIIFWIMGSLDEPNTRLVHTLLLTSLLGLITAYAFTPSLNALALGQQDAYHLGVNVDRTRKRLFLLASLLTGVTVSVTGIIGFVGLVVPHFVRLFFGADHRIVLPASFLAGSLFLLVCDILSRVIIAPLELPIGVITGLVGGGLFIYAMMTRYREAA